MVIMKAKRRPKVEFEYTPGQPVTVAPKAGYAGCYVLRHEFHPAAKPPAPTHVYTVGLYIDAAVGASTFVLKDDGGGIVVDVPEGFNLAMLTDAVHGPVKGTPGCPEPPVVSVEDRP